MEPAWAGAVEEVAVVEGGGAAVAAVEAAVAPPAVEMARLEKEMALLNGREQNSGAEHPAGPPSSQVMSEDCHSEKTSPMPRERGPVMRLRYSAGMLRLRAVVRPLWDSVTAMLARMPLASTGKEMS